MLGLPGIILEIACRSEQGQMTPPVLMAIAAVVIALALAGKIDIRLALGMVPQAPR